MDWILSHIDDPTLDTIQPREYVLYLCPSPSNPIGRHIEEFLNAASRLPIVSSAMLPPLPHISLTPFFPVYDDQLSSLCSTLQRSIDRLGEIWVADSEARLESYASPNFLGLFLSQGKSQALQTLASGFLQDLKSKNISQSSSAMESSAESAEKALHLTLAFQFPECSFAPLKQLAEDLVFAPLLREKVATEEQWEFRLYSKGSQAHGSEGSVESSVSTYLSRAR